MDDPAQAAEADLEAGRALYHAGRLDDAERWATQALARHPDSYGLWNLKGAVLRQLKRPTEAVAALERAVGLDPREYGARMNLG
ncbi:MAG TPA: tetratricopeptide repeat protein, partial [Caulobacteraceae bacterium]